VISAKHLRSIALAIQGVASLASLALAAAVWCGAARLERIAEQQSRQRAELKEFHASLVAGIQSLADQSGMLTSADLCPVRFRLRFDRAVGYPHPPIISKLVNMASPGEIVSPQFSPSTGTIHFGLVPPGRYRLNIRLFDAYELNHEFDVLPGVPVDRLVLCPNADPAGATVAVDVALPTSLQERGLIFLAHLCRDSVSLGDWDWSAIDPGGATVVVASSESAAHLLMQHLWNAEHIVFPLSLKAPYPRCRLTVLCWSAADAACPGELATFQFKDALELPRVLHSAPLQTTRLNVPALRYQGNLTQTPMQWRWTIELPPEARGLLEDRLGVSLQPESLLPDPMTRNDRPSPDRRNLDSAAQKT
jgi:hypothetical protein